MSKYFKRIGTSKFRYQFDILLQEARINLPGIGVTPVAMVFKRGGKRIESKGKVMLSAEGVATINERMCMLATLYRDKKGKFQEKTATIQVLAYLTDKKTGKLSSGKPIAVTKIDLSRYAIAPTRNDIKNGSISSRGQSSGRSQSTPKSAPSDPHFTYGEGTSTQCVHQICLKLLKSGDPEARLSLEVRSIYLQEAATLSELSSIGSDCMSMGEMSDSDTGDDRSGFGMSNIALRQKAKKLSLQNKLEIGAFNRQQSQNVAQNQGESKEEEPIISPQFTKEPCEPREAPQPFSFQASPPHNDSQHETLSNNRSKSPMDYSGTQLEEVEKDQERKLADTPRVATYAVTREAPPSHPNKLMQHEKYGVKNSRNRQIIPPNASQSTLKKNSRSDQISKVIRDLKSKSSLTDTRAAIAAHSRTMLSKALGQRRLNNANGHHYQGKKHSASGSESQRRLSISFSAEEGGDVDYQFRSEESVTPRTEQQVQGGSPPSGGGSDYELKVLKQKMRDIQLEKEDLQGRVQILTKKNTELKIEAQEKGAEISDCQEELREVVDKNRKLSGQLNERDSLIKKLREEIVVQKNVVRDVRAKNEAMIEAATKQVRQVQERFHEVVERHTVESDKEIDELRLKVAQGEERIIAECQRQKLLMQEIDQKESKIILMEKECAEVKHKFEQLLYNYHNMEEQLMEQKAQQREKEILNQRRETKKQKLKIQTIRAKLFEIRNLKNTIHNEMQLQAGEMQEYQKEINKQLSQVRIDYQLQRERFKQLQSYSNQTEQDLMEAKVSSLMTEQMAVGRYQDDSSRFQKHIEKIAKELEQSKEYAGKLEVDMIKTRQELAESVNVIGEYEKENLDLQYKLEMYYGQIQTRR